MSYSFEVNLSQIPLVSEVFSKLSLADLRCREGIEVDKLWPQGVIHLHRHLMSTRAVELSLENNNLNIRVLAFSSPEDWELSLRLAEIFAEYAGGIVSSESSDDAIHISTLRTIHDQRWVEKQITSNAAFVRHYIRVEKREPMKIPGPVHLFSLGKQLFEELENAGPKAEFPQRLLAAIRQTQYIDPEDNL